MALSPVDTQLGVTSHPADIQKLAGLDVLNWAEILSHKTVLLQGTLPSSAGRDTLLFSQSLSPRSLHSQTQKTAINHLAEMFAQWHGDLVFEFVVSIPYFVATKIVVAFVPDSANVDDWPAAVLAGLQNSVICNPANQSSVSLTVPFISTSNWLPTNTGTGVIAAKLLDPLVSSFELSGGLPWTLIVSADPSSFSFRYIAPPPLQSFDGSGTVPTDQPTLADMTLARSMSTTGFKTEMRAREMWPLVQQPTTNVNIQYESMMLVPRSRVEYVMQKVRGQFPTSGFPDDCIANMFDSPATSLGGYSTFIRAPVTSLYPFLSQAFLMSMTKSSTSPSPSSNSAPFQVVQFTDGVGFNKTSFHYWLEVPETAFGVLSAAAPSLWLTVFAAKINGGSSWYAPAKLDYVGNLQQGNRYWHQFRLDTSGDSVDVFPFNPDATIAYNAMAVWASHTRAQSAVISALQQIESCPSTVTHLAIYTTMPPDLASTFNQWLITADNTPPPAAAIKYTLSFSPNQSALAYNAGRFTDGPQQRGLIWKLFKLFKGDETKWWAWLVKGLDIVVDALIGAFVGRASVPYVVPIGRDSGFRVEAVGAYDEALISSAESSVLEYIPPAPSVNLVEHLRVAELRAQRDRSLTPAAPTSGPSSLIAPGSRSDSQASVKSITHFSRRNSRHLARHPSSKSSKRRLFR